MIQDLSLTNSLDCGPDDVLPTGDIIRCKFHKPLFPISTLCVCLYIDQLFLHRPFSRCPFSVRIHGWRKLVGYGYGLSSQFLQPSSQSCSIFTGSDDRQDWERRKKIWKMAVRVWGRCQSPLRVMTKGRKMRIGRLRPIWKIGSSEDIFYALSPIKVILNRFNLMAVHQYRASFQN